MTFLTRQDRTPKFEGQVLPDLTESGLIFSNILTTDKVPGHKGKEIVWFLDSLSFENLPNFRTGHDVW